MRPSPLRLLPLALLLCTGSDAALAQCSYDDGFEPNDDCASAIPGMLGTTSGLSLTFLSRYDYWSYVVPVGQAIQITVNSDPQQSALNVSLSRGVGTCSFPYLVDQGQFGMATQQVVYDNHSGIPQTVNLSLWMGDYFKNCTDYSVFVELIPNPCTPLSADALEDNDTCSTAVAPGTSPVAGLSVTTDDEDFFSFVVPPSTEITVSALHTVADGDINLRLIDSSLCMSYLTFATSTTDDETLSWTNYSRSPVSVVLQVTLLREGLVVCSNGYTLEWSYQAGFCMAFPPDALEPNDDCSTARPLGAGSYPGLTVRRDGVDNDWYEVTVPPGSELQADVLFDQVFGDIDLELYVDCGGALIDSSFLVLGQETLNYVNAEPSPRTVLINVYIWPADFNECTGYDLTIDLQPSSPGFSAFCFGDGSGAQCPCGNNSSAGHPGGCAHQNGDGAILLPSGLPSATNDSLSFDLASASFSTFGLLVSADNPLPQTGGCVGCGIPAFDGLRCAGGNFRRHGTRGIVPAGMTSEPWGAASGSPLIAANGFVAGQSRSFFVFYRTNPNTTCMTEQNSSNAVQVTFAP